MKRQIPLLLLLSALLLAACGQSATPAPAATLAPTVAAPVATEAPTEVATAETEAEPTVVAEETAEPAATETMTATETVTMTTSMTATETLTATETVTATEAMTETGEAEALAGCLEPTADTQLISSPEAGYCFLIPATFERSEFSDDEGFNLGIYGPESTPGHRERAFVTVTAAATETLEVSVQTVISDVLASVPGITPTQTNITLGGLPAVQVDGLPGQDINRKIYAVNEGQRYELTFVPFVEEARPDASAEAEELFTLMVDSFQFITPTTATSSYAALLTWEGDIDGACHTLTIESTGEAAVGVCGDAPSMTSTLDAANLEWLAVQQQFGAIDAETSAGKIVFQGQGLAEGDVWAQALATWASFTAMEINAGRASASARTTLAWQITDSAEHSGQCSQVLVLAYGYAYANLVPCEGNGQSTQVAAGWLTDTELETFYEWVATGERVESEMGYLDAQGETPVAPDEITTWATAIYARMIQ